MLGVLVDVSGSMQYALSRSYDASVERTHAILTSVVNIVKQEVARHGRTESIFVSAFGLNQPNVSTCDLISLLECVADTNDTSGGYEGLSRLARQHRVSHADPWIRKHLSEPEARLLYNTLKSDPAKTKELVHLIPYQTTMYAAKPVGFFGKLFSERYSEKGLVERSDAYQCAKAIIDDTLLRMKQPKPRPIQDVSDMMDTLLSSKDSRSSRSSLHDRIEEAIQPLKPYIYGFTPMCQAMYDALNAFRSAHNDTKVLFILSDGESSDGNPCKIAKDLREAGVTIVTCFITADSIPNCKRLFDPNVTCWSGRGQRAMFEMSSIMHNTHTPVSYLIDAGWELPTSGESRLFVQANTIEVVDEFCNLVVSQMTNSCDAIVHLLEKLPLATYITKKNADIVPEMQKDLTCYAHAIATVFHLAMHRIIGRDGGIPDFRDIRDEIIKEFGSAGADTEKVIKEVCPKYRLRYKQFSDERRARQAINERRPVIADFWLFEEQFMKFWRFYKCTPKQILMASDMTGTTGNKFGHAVVLTSCDSKSLTFMNSWGPEFAEGGFFRVENANVLNNSVLFFDIYWEENDLRQSELAAYKRSCIRRAKELAQTYPSIQDLHFRCPQCDQISQVHDFDGNILEAKCPKCHKCFTPTNDRMIQSLYFKRFK